MSNKAADAAKAETTTEPDASGAATGTEATTPTEPTTPPDPKTPDQKPVRGRQAKAPAVTQPAAKGVAADLAFKLLPDDAQVIIDLFMKPYTPDALWAALEAAGRLGKLACDYLESTPNRPKMNQVVGAKTIMNDELCQQLTERLQASPPITTGDGPPAVAFDPVLASLIVTLAGRVAVELINRFGG